LIQVETEGLVELEPARDFNQSLGKLGVDAPVAHFVGIGQGTARDATPNARCAGMAICRLIEAVGEMKEPLDLRATHRLHDHVAIANAISTTIGDKP
jgi:hypothetical protein